MKREVAIALLSLFALVGCTKSGDLPFDDETQPTDNISLSVESGEPFTRGSVVDSEAKMASVGLFCAHTVANDWSTSLTDFNKMNNAKFTHESGAWVWKPADNGGNNQPIWGHTSLTEKYTFFAYSPHQATGVNVVEGQPQISYTVTPTVASQKDFMTAKPRKNIHPQSGGKVHMQFEHALTKVSFSVKGVSTRKIKSITIKDVHDNGTLKFIDSDNNPDTPPHFEWSDHSGTQSYTVSTSADGGNGAIDDITPNADENTPTTLTTESGYLFMLPQSVAGKEIDVVVINGDDSESTETLTLPVGSAWSQGTHTNYVITLAINEVDLAVNITSWDDQPIESNVQGTYLNILDNSLGIFDGKDALIYYSTDHSPDSEVTASYEKTGAPTVTGDLTKHTTASGNYFNFPTASSNLSSGDYIVTIEAGSHLARKLKVTVAITGKVVVSLIAWDDNAMEENTEGTHFTLSHAELDITASETIPIYYSTDAGSVSSSVDNAKISLDTSVDGKITLTAADDITAPATATLEIRADKITKKIKINIK